MLENSLPHVLDLDDWKKWHVYRTREVNVLSSSGQDNKLISRHVKLQVSNQLAMEESRLELKSEVIAKDKWQILWKLYLSFGR